MNELSDEDILRLQALDRAIDAKTRRSIMRLTQQIEQEKDKDMLDILIRERQACYGCINYHQWQNMRYKRRGHSLPWK